MSAFNKRLIPIQVEEKVSIPSAMPNGQARTVSVLVPALQDPEDGEIYLGVEAAEVLDKAKMRYAGVLAPWELLELRERLGLTQKEIAEVFQIGEKTWSRWENGHELVSRSLNVMLRAAYEGKITLPWLRAILGNAEPLKLESHLRVSGCGWLNESIFQTGFSSWRPGAMTNLQSGVGLMTCYPWLQWESGINLRLSSVGAAMNYPGVNPLVRAGSYAITGNSSSGGCTLIGSAGSCSVTNRRAGERTDGVAMAAGNNEEMPLCA